MANLVAQTERLTKKDILKNASPTERKTLFVISGLRVCVDYERIVSKSESKIDVLTVGMSLLTVRAEVSATVAGSK